MAWDIFNPAKQLASLDSVPAAFRGMYELDDDGVIYCLTADAVVEVDRLRTERDQVSAEHQSKVEALRTQGEELAKKHGTTMIDGELTKACLACGADPLLVAGCCAVLRADYDWKVVDRNGKSAVVAATDSGELSARSVAATFMRHGPGREFLSRKPQKPSDNSYAERFRALTGR